VKMVDEANARSDCCWKVHEFDFLRDLENEE
jgi:hypothetical protein